MPFGLCNAPAAFQALINEVIFDLLETLVVVYSDVILVFSHNMETHHIHIQQVLYRLWYKNLYCKKEKSNIYCKEVEFLG